jgi:hypothetical protein
LPFVLEEFFITNFFGKKRKKRQPSLHNLLITSVIDRLGTYSQTCIKRTMKKWLYKTVDLLQEVKFM